MARPGLRATVLRCPFCNATESARLDLEGRRFIVFPCQFTPEVDPSLSDPEVEERFARSFGSGGDAHFRRTCDALHVYVTKGEGARFLTSPRPTRSESPA
jgi:hypothetical protein